MTENSIYFGKNDFYKAACYSVNIGTRYQNDIKIDRKEYFIKINIKRIVYKTLFFNFNWILKRLIFVPASQST